MKLWLVRHAEVVAAEGLCYGASDLPADAAATRDAAQALARQLPQGLPMHVSPLQRCELLAQSLKALRPDLMLKTDARLREFDFGRWERRRWADIGRAEFDAWLANFAQGRPGGGENVTELMARVAEAWGDWRAGGRDALWVTHAGVIRAARLLADGRRPLRSAADWPAEGLAFGAAMVLRAEPLP